MLVQGLEADHSVQTIAELWREQALDIAHFVARLTRIGKANGGLVHGLCAGIGGHDDDHIAEVGFAAVVIRQGAMVHDLQQHIENVGVRFFNFVEQQNAMRFLGHGFGEQATLVKAHIAWRRTN